MFIFKTRQMKAISNIRSLYLPVQPSVKQLAGDVIYHEFLPDTGLRDFIYCYWQLKTTQPLTEPFHYRVVADGCIDIFFELHNPRNSFIMGFSNAFTAFPLEQSFNYVGVRFLPGMFPMLYKISAGELSDRVENLDMVVPAVSDFLSGYFMGNLSVTQIAVMLDAHFLTLMSKKLIAADSRFCTSIDMILRSSGTISMEKDLQAGISIRQLRRLFEFYIGGTPKAFGKIVRFQKMLQPEPFSGYPGGKKHYLDAGYYDQAHFIKEFKRLYGLTPGKAFGK
jgi:hypothetical protein